MLAQEAGLTLAQFVGLVGLNVTIIGLVIAQMRRSSERDEEVKTRLTKLEIAMEYHLRNGARHERGDP